MSSVLSFVSATYVIHLSVNWILHSKQTLFEATHTLPQQQCLPMNVVRLLTSQCRFLIFTCCAYNMLINELQPA